MDFRDRITDAALADIARLISIAYVRYQRACRIETAAQNAPESANGELDNLCPERLHVSEVDA
jgi:hypothetical protein